MPKFHKYDGPANFSLVNYYESEEWKTKAKNVKDLKKECARCGTRYKLQVHHLTYKNVPNEKPEDLVVLCRYCHRLVHAANAKIVRLPGEFPDPPDKLEQRLLYDYETDTSFQIEDDNEPLPPPYQEEDYM